MNSGRQTKAGKAFEYACLSALFRKYSSAQPVEVVYSPQLKTAKGCYSQVNGVERNRLDRAAAAGINMLDLLEPGLSIPARNDPLLLSIQTDAQGQQGDVRDVMCTRKHSEWEIGISCKHNHSAVKHSRLSSTIDFGKEWLGFSCSPGYFEQISPIFSQLELMRKSARASGNQIEWNELEGKLDKERDFYVPVLEAFMRELARLADEHAETPANLVRYLVGKTDFYKIISDESRKVTRLEAYNFDGTLNKAVAGVKPATKAPKQQLPTQIVYMGFRRTFLKDFRNTIEVICDHGWQISLRIHNASSKIEPSFKFDVQLISQPVTLHTQQVAWS